MTVSYSREVATSRLGTFARLLFRWKGSIYRLLYRETLFLLLLYYLICVIYHFALNEDLKREFEKFAVFCQKYTDFVPLTFVLGFYVSIIIGRWWNIFSSLSWPDRLCLHIQTFVQGEDDRGRTIRRTAARYINLAQVLVLRDISTAVRKRFPTLEHLIEGGFLTDEEYKQYESIEMQHHKFWVPLQWTCSLLAKSRKEGRIEAEPTLVRMMEEIFTIRNFLSNLLCYDWVSVPLVYTQVVTIAVYSYFLACLFGRQYLLKLPGDDDDVRHDKGHEMDMYFPLFTVFQFFFYMGWLKVAESIMNPLGEDDDDFEVNYLIERNLQVAYCIVDENCMKIPPIKHDIHWNEPEASVPHTQASAGLKSNPPIPSAIEPESVEMMRAQSNLSLSNTENTRKKSLRPNGDIQRTASIRGSNNNLRQNIRRLVSNVSNRLSHTDIRSSVLVEDTSGEGGLDSSFYYVQPKRAPFATTELPSPTGSVSSQQPLLPERKTSMSSKAKLTTVSEVNSEDGDQVNLIELTPEERTAMRNKIISDVPLIDQEDVVQSSSPLLHTVSSEAHASVPLLPDAAHDKKKSSGKKRPRSLGIF